MPRRDRFASAVLAILTLSAVTLALGHLLQKTVRLPASEAPLPPQALQPTASSNAQLTESEIGRALLIAQQDPEVGAALACANWSLAEAGVWLRNGERVGAALLIRFREPVWVSGRFRDAEGETYRASLWLGSLHVLVDLREGRVGAVSPGLARAPADPPVTLGEEVEKARQVALNWVRGSRRAYLNAVFHTRDHPSGLAVFRVESTCGESLVAVDLAGMVVDENLSGAVTGCQG